MIDWSRPPGGLAVALLGGPAVLYRAAVALRNALYDAEVVRPRRLPCRVVSVGNLTVGGSGKTPLVSYLAGALREAGQRVGVLSRGYRRLGRRGPLIVSDGRSILADPAAAGDEPFLIARDNPAVAVAVGADRLEAGAFLLRAAACDLVLLDDGFQHRRLARDVDLLVVDGPDPWGNGRMLPLGPLREPPAGLARTDGIVVTRSDGRLPGPLAAVIERHNPEAMVFHARLRPRGFVRPDGEMIVPASLRGLSAFAFSGIARPERFEDDLRALGLRVAGVRRFRDHHRYRRGDLAEVARAARRVAADLLVTTEKDRVRIAADPEGLPLYALAQEMVFPDGPDPSLFIHHRLAAPPGSVR